MSWLGGRDSNPDNVVQRALHGFRSAPVCAVLLRFSPHVVQSATVRFAALPCKVSHSVSPADYLVQMILAA